MTTTSFHAIDPRTGAPLDPRFTEASAEDDIRAVVDAAAGFGADGR